MKKLNKKGFTLAELLIVVAIIAVMAAIAIPIFTAQLSKAQAATDEANIRSGYAAVSAEVLSDPDAAKATKTATITWTLNQDASATKEAVKAYEAKGSGTDVNVGGQTIKWTAGAKFTYVYDGSSIVITPSK